MPEQPNASVIIPDPQDRVAEVTQRPARLGPVVGIGASAGGLEAVAQLLQQLPVSTGMGFVLVQHLDPHHKSILAELLATHTAMPVKQAVQDTRVEPNRIYVIPPNTRIAIRRGILNLSPREEGRALHMPIDYFLCSLAEDQKNQAIGVILSGAASDGTVGLEAVKAEGGITFAQDGSAKFESMPRNAIASGVVDFVLPPDGIARELAAIAQHSYFAPATTTTGALVEDGPVLQRILTLLRDKTGVDFLHYKASTIQRRLRRRMALHHMDEPEQFLALLEQDPSEIQALFDDVLITVTEFFRDPAAFDALKEKAFPIISRNRKPGELIRVWVPGCSSGEEVYSIAICLTEYLEQTGQSFPILQIFGTDVSERSIERARLARYSEAIASVVSAQRLKRFFMKLESGYQIARRIRDLCIFSRQDLTNDPPLVKMDLISCRNLLIYFGSALQERVMAILGYSLLPKGFLLLGNSETTGSRVDHFVAVDREHKIYTVNLQLAKPRFELPARVPGSPAVPAFQPTTRVDDPVAAVDHEADRLLLAEYAPSGFLVNAERQVIKFRGEIGLYLAPAAGDATFDVLKLVREDIALPLRLLLEEAKSKDTVVRREGVQVRRNDCFQEVNLIVRPISKPSTEQYFLVLFEDASHQNRREPEQRPNMLDGSERGQADQDFAQELVSTRAYLQRIIEDLRSANEEAQSSNEELQSTNEELQTAKEELQSTNEELRTLNEESQSRSAELSQVNNDLINLLTSMQIPIVMLNRELRIRRFTPVSEKALNLIATDVGRPISDLKPRINLPDLEQLLAKVIGSLEDLEREVQDQNGRWYSLRIQPYRIAEDQTDGAVLQLLDIDQLKRTLEHVEQARDYAEAILATVREPLLVLEPELRVQTANRAFFDTFRVSPHETLNRVIYELGNGQWNLPKVHQMLDEILHGTAGQLQDVEIEHDFDRVGWRVFQLHARRIKRGGETSLILLALADITDRKRAVEAKYRRLFEAAKDSILIVNGETGEITDVNPFTIELCGYGREELVGKRFWEVAPLKELKNAQSVFVRLHAERVVRFPEVSLQSREGRHVEAEVVGNLYCEGENEVIQFNIRDVTEHRSFDRQLQQTARLESLGLLAGGVAHDFNNLLTGIMGNASLALTDAPPGGPYQSALKEVVQASQRAADLTNQMLAYAGKGRFDVRPLDVSGLVREISTLVRSSIPKTVEVDLKLADNLPAVEADASQIQQLIMNLIINGGEAIGERNRGYVRVTTRQQQLDAEYIRLNFSYEINPGTYVSVEITDSGSGMDKATQARIFDPFFTTKFTGRGLGLAAALGIVRGHSGAIRVDSAPGRGTTFEVVFPAVQSAPISSPAESKPEELHGTGTVLVVDDEEVVLRMAKLALQRYGYQVFVASNVEEAVRIVRERVHELRLVIIDLTMPVTGGEEGLAQIKKIRPDIPVLLSSGYDEARAVQRFGESDLAGFIQKPYTAQTILKSVKSVLG